MNLNLNYIASNLCHGLIIHDVMKIIYNYWIDKVRQKNISLVFLFQSLAWNHESCSKIISKFEYFAFNEAYHINEELQEVNF